MERLRLDKLPADRATHYQRVRRRNNEIIREATGSYDVEIDQDNRDLVFQDVEKHLFSFLTESGAPFSDLLRHPTGTDDIDPRMKSEVDDIMRVYTREKQVEAEDLAARGYGLVLVRPEIMHEVDKVHDFLMENDIEVVKSQSLQLSAHQYVGLYSHAFIDPNKQPHVRRRALGYIGHDLQALVIKHKDKRINNNDFMQFFVEEHKGVAGLSDDKTLRGGLIYNLLHDVQEPQNSSVRLAVDPLGLYESTDRSNEYSIDVNPYLANLPGVHVPDSSEIVKDLCVISGNMTLAEFTGRERVDKGTFHRSVSL